MKTATAPTPAKRRRSHATPLARDRQLLRDLAQLAERADPEMLAALVTEIDRTLNSCAKIEQFFKTYVLALSRRRAH